MSVTSAILESIHAADYVVTTRRVHTRDGERYRIDARDKDGELWMAVGEDGYLAACELAVMVGCDLEG